MSDDPNPRVVSVPVALLEEIAEHVNLTLPVRYGPILDVLIAAAPQEPSAEEVYNFNLFRADKPYKPQEQPLIDPKWFNATYVLVLTALIGLALGALGVKWVEYAEKLSPPDRW